MKLYKMSKGIVLQKDNDVYLLHDKWDSLINRKNLFSFLSERTRGSERIGNSSFDSLINTQLQAPIGKQEVWAAGVTYLRSRDARMEESKTSGGADFYDKVYAAERPELFREPHSWLKITFSRWPWNPD